MRFKLGSLEIIINKKGQRPKWTKEKPPISAKDEERLAREILAQACVIYSVDPDSLKTGSRAGDLPDTRKIISWTLTELGYSSEKIYKALGTSMGVPATIRHQVLAVRSLSARTHPRLFGAIDKMRQLFIFS